MRIAPIAALLSLAIVGGCDGDTPSGAVPCTQRGCGPTIVAELLGRPETFTLVFRGEGFEPVTWTCSSSDPCPGRLWVFEATPERVTVEVTSEAVEHVEEFDLDYETYRPNGPDCPPQCRRATITVDLR